MPTADRRTEPRRGLAARVGFIVAATGIVSAAIDRQAIAGVTPDVPMAVAFGLFLAIILMATFRRPMPGSTWIVFLAFALMYVVQAVDIHANVEGILSYVLFALGAVLITAPHLRPLMVGAFALWTAALWVYGPTGLIDELPIPIRIAAIVALAWTVVVIADPRRMHPSDRLRRAGYGVLAIACVTGSIARHLVVHSVGIAPGEGIALVVSVALPALTYIRMPAPRREVIATRVALGLGDIRWAYAGEVMLLAVLAISRIRVPWRPFALATVIGNGIIARQWILAGIDPSWALFIFVAWALRVRRWWPALFMGLAIADRQPAWFVAPF